MIGQAIGAGIGSTISGIASSVIQGEYNKAEAQKNRDFQERMSNTAIQRQIADIRNAGLSPAMLFGNSTSGATSPSGNTASISKPNFDLGGIIGLIERDRELDHKEKMQDRKLDYLEEKNNHDYEQRQYNKKDFSKFYTDLDKIEL